MKKIVIPALVLTAACAVFAACGGMGNESVNENTDPATIKSETLSAEKWESAFKDENNYTVKTVVGTHCTEGGATASEEITLVYRCDGAKSRLNLCRKKGGETELEGEAYFKRGDKTAFWQRRKEKGNWTEWEGDTADGGIGDVVGSYGDIAFIKEHFEKFTYNDAENGYVATRDGLADMQTALKKYICGILSQSEDGVCSYDVESFVVKFSGGKPSACLFELTPEQRLQPSPTVGPVHPMLPPFPRLYHRYLRRFAPIPHGVAPRIRFEIPEREAEKVAESEIETPAACGMCVSQIFYDYGSTQVHLPANLPTLDE